ncbi:unnamed protein product [Eruca vesicaria subsp. sativa]|uniref:SAWADEE domain-containing protein n=1 Tax=Eruca vesicaria subsp. sativa TaxID=29727 RepID=A0ABC8JBE9_ERUVS|nr:unnamed protein product [Eruca vesicaria subsp. sativa]
MVQTIVNILQALDEKVLIFKKKRRKNYRRTTWHRHELTKLRITDIQGIEKPLNMLNVTLERKGKTVVQFKQIWNWFQNRRYALRERGNKAPGNLKVTSMPCGLDPTNHMRNVLPPSAGAKSTHMTGSVMTPSHSGISGALYVFISIGFTRCGCLYILLIILLVPGVKSSGSDNSYLEFEAKSGMDGAWYDVQAFLAHRNLEIGDSEVQVRFVGFEVEEDEWINVKKHVRQRSLPCEASECVSVLAGDHVLLPGREIKLFTLTPLFLMHKEGDTMSEIVIVGSWCGTPTTSPRFDFHLSLLPSNLLTHLLWIFIPAGNRPLRKICRRPETDYRLQQLHMSQFLVPPDVKDPTLSTASATSVQPSSNAATVPTGSSTAQAISYVRPHLVAIFIELARVVEVKLGDQELL